MTVTAHRRALPVVFSVNDVANKSCIWLNWINFLVLTMIMAKILQFVSKLSWRKLTHFCWCREIFIEDVYVENDDW